VTVSGLVSQPPGQERVFQLSEFADHILCERHNTALNKLDATAIEVVRTLDHYQKDQATNPTRTAAGSTSSAANASNAGC
jgi:hypothetical protein